jgi:hypothetical protein
MITAVFYGDKNHHETAENNCGHHKDNTFFVSKEYREAYGFKFAECCGNCCNIVWASFPMCKRHQTLPGIKDKIFVVRDMVCDFYNVPDTPRDTALQNEWARQVYERDNYTCQKCGVKGCESSQSHIDHEGRTLTVFDPGLKLYAHHIKPYALFPKLAWNLDNGITLCGKCHIKAHEEYGGFSLHRLPGNPQG